jgi:hypothetical protein
VNDGHAYAITTGEGASTWRTFPVSCQLSFCGRGGSQLTFCSSFAALLCFTSCPFSFNESRFPRSLVESVLATSIGSDAAILHARKTSAGTCSLRLARPARLEEEAEVEADGPGSDTRLNVLWLIDNEGGCSPFLSGGMIPRNCSETTCYLLYSLRTDGVTPLSNLCCRTKSAL